MYNNITQRIQPFLSEENIDQQSDSSQLIPQIEQAKRSLYEQFVLGEIGAEGYREAKAGFDAELERLRHTHSKKEELETENELRKLAEEAQRTKAVTRPLVDLLIDKVLVYPNNHIEVCWAAK